MSHYKSNLRDIEFNLFEFNKVQEYPADVFAGMDRNTMGDILHEIDRLATEEYAAAYEDQDRIPLELIDGEVTLPESVKVAARAFRDGGWDRLGLSEEMGGLSVPPSLIWAVSEMLLASNTTVQFYAGGSLFAHVLFDEGTESQKELAKLWVDRGWAGTMVLTEPDAGSDVGSGITRAIDQGDGTWHIEGVKRFITSGEHDLTENIVHLVLARPQAAGPGTKGLSLFVVPKYLISGDGALGPRNGVYATGIEKKMGLKGSATCELTFGAEEPAIGYLVGDKHDGIRQMFRVIEYARMMIGTKAMGTLSTGYLNALQYAQERKQGPDLAEATDKTAPRVEIINHPNIRRMLMTQKAHAEGMRALVLYAAWVQDQIVLHPDDDNWERLNDLLLPLVKGYSSEKAYELLSMALQVFGGAGYTQDLPMEQYLRDARIDTIYEGTTAIQAMDLFFRKIARDQGATLARLAARIVEFVKGGDDEDALSEERELLGRQLDDTQAHLGSMVENLMAYGSGAKWEIYKVGFQTNHLLESIAETIIAWLMLRQAEAALPKVEDDPFYVGKVEAARWFVRHVGPKASLRRAAAVLEDGHLMDIPVEAF